MLVSAVAVVALWMTMLVLHGNTAVQPYTRLYSLYSRIRLYRLGALAQRASREEKGGRPPADRHHHSRARARARVTMRTRIMRARGRARARARGDTPWICSRIINGVEDYRRAVLGSSKNQPGHSGVYRGIPLYSRSRSSAIRGIPLYSRVAAIPV